MKTQFPLKQVLVLLIFFTVSVRGQVAFLPLGYLDGFGPTSEAYAVSADGTKVVGYSTTTLTANQACWWTSSGIQALPGAQNWYSNGAYSISADGSMVVGANSFGGTEEAFYWTALANTQYVPFPPPPPPTTHLRASVSWEVSADGKVIVGGVTYATGDGINAARYPRAFRWSPGETSATLLPQFALDFRSDTALGVNHDGSLIVGTAFTSLNTQTAVYWNAAGGPHVISQASDTIQAVSANSVTPDGSVIVGSAVDTSTGKGVAFKWTAAGGTIALPAPTTGVYAYSGITCYSISGDGRVIVGFGENVIGREEAIFWVDEQPYRVSDVAFAAGQLPPSWEPFRAYGVDFHGNTICGQGQATSGKIEGYVLILDNTPDPPVLVPPRIQMTSGQGADDITISYQALPGLRYRVIGGSSVTTMSPVTDWEFGLGFDLLFTATPAVTGGASQFFISLEVSNE